MVDHDPDHGADAADRKPVAKSVSALDTLPDKKVYELTQPAYDRLHAEYVELTTVRKIDIAKKIETARELGDLSENGDYHAAKEEQGKMAGRIGHLHNILENHRIVEAGDGDEVRTGSIVTIRYIDSDGTVDDDTEKYLLGSIEERSADMDVVTPESALGVAMLGSTAGASVSYETPTGMTLTVEIVTIE